MFASRNDMNNLADRVKKLESNDERQDTDIQTLFDSLNQIGELDRYIQATDASVNEAWKAI